MYIFTDGSTKNNGKNNAIGGIGIYIPEQNIQIDDTIETNDNNISEYSISYTLISNDKIKVTNQISELLAVIIGIEKAITLTNEEIYVYTDSKYVIDCATTWSKNWINNNWKKSNGKIIDNLWLIYRLIQLTHNKCNPIIFKHIKSHDIKPNNPNSNDYILWNGNNIADQLAQSASNLSDENKFLNWSTLAGFLINGMKNNMSLQIKYDDYISTFFKENFDLQ
jgi:ribonuclease HI